MRQARQGARYHVKPKPPLPARHPQAASFASCGPCPTVSTRIPDGPAHLARARLASQGEWTLSTTDTGQRFVRDGWDIFKDRLFGGGALPYLKSAAMHYL